MNEALSRIFNVLGLDYETVSPVLDLIESQDYGRILEKMLEAHKFNSEEWKTAALGHQLIVACWPRTANVWLKIIRKRLCSDSRVNLGLYQGTIVGLLEAGVWLEKSLIESELPENLMMGLAEIVCHCRTKEAMRMPHGHRDVDYSSLQKRLTEALDIFLVPQKTTHLIISEREDEETEPVHKNPELTEKEMQEQRFGQTKKALAYMNQHLSNGKLEYVSKLFVEYIVNSLLEKRTPKEKISAIQGIL